MGKNMAVFNNGDELTSFEDACSILAELWSNHKDDKNFKDFISYNDLGLPLAFLIDSDLVIPNEMAKNYIEETWVILLESLGVSDDRRFTSLDELFDSAETSDE